MDNTMVLRKKIINPALSNIQKNNNNIGKKIVDDIGDVIIKKTKILSKEQISKLVNLKREQNLDQNMLANKLNVKHSDIKDAELGKEIKLKTYNAICKLLNGSQPSVNEVIKVKP
jgi:ribosome-binding protein aMBF1 (putative translation factor)